jgi:uncharacterized protein (DUF1501 family)
VRNSRTALQAYDEVQQAGRLTTPTLYPPGRFAESLKFAAQLLRHDAHMQIIALQQGSYDTHENQYNRHAADLGELSSGIAAFISDLETHGLSNRVLIVLWSEFSRRVVPNASAGTDHGAAQALLLIGDAVRAGVYGMPPSLAQDHLIDKGNLPMAIDFRQVYGTLLNGWLGVNAMSVLGADWGTLPLLL